MTTSESKKQRAEKWGRFAETIAALFLTFKGYKILERRYKTPVGEIDIIARKKNTLAIIEVKARKTTESALQSLTPKMRKRIEKAALYYLSDCNKNKSGNKPDNTPSMDIRFDLVAFSPPLTIIHLDNAWIMES